MRRRLQTLLLACVAALSCGEPQRGVGGDGGGRVHLAPGEPVVIRRAGDWTFTYTAGPAGIATGGALRFRLWPEWGWSPPQVERPGAAGFVAHRVLEGDARLEARMRRLPRSKLPAVELRVREGSLRPGERVELRYAGAKAGHFAGDFQEFRFAVDADGDGSARPLAEQPALRVLPGPPAELWVVAHAPAPGRARAEARASVLDRWHNLIRSRGVAGEPPGAKARDAETGLAGVSGRVWPARPGRERVFWGDLHGHSAWSDGTGTPVAYFEYARDAAALDFAALTEHDAIGPRVLDAPTWRRLRDVADAFHDPGRFVTLHGWEYTNWSTGHLTILSPSRELPVFSAAAPETARVGALMERLAELEVPVLAVPHHPGGSTMPTDWDHFDPRFMHVVELFSVHGSSECLDCAVRVQNPRAGSFVRDALLRGHRLSFIGSGDTHNGHPGRSPRREPYRTGLVGVWAPELTRDAIWEALVGGRSFATTGARTEPRLDFDGEAFVVDVRAARRLASVEIVKGDRVVFREDGPALQIERRWKDPEPPRPGDFHYLRVTESDGHMAWTSPIYLP